MNALIGFTRKDWWKLLKEVNYSVDRGYRVRALQVTLAIYFNSRFSKLEEQTFYSDVKKIVVKEPIFILGHWRNGTSLLHELLAQDSQFAYPNLFEVSNPHIFLKRGPIIEKYAESHPPQKRPMDNMSVTLCSPGEDEPAIAVLSLRSPAISWMFPRREEIYDRYLTFDGCSQEDILRWKNAIVLFAQKLTYKYQRRLVMKSPAHTARIKLLLDLFPDARFIHIQRDPLVVFQSTQKLYDTAVAGAYLQKPPEGSVTAGILRRYEDMYDAYFDQKDLIAADRLVEIKFEHFEKDILNQLRLVYQNLGINGFEAVEPKFIEYLEKRSGYQKNVHPTVSEPLRSEIINRWGRCYTEWGYPT